MLTTGQKALLDTGYKGRVEGLVDGEALHRCPTCGDLGECYSTSDNYHSCKWCGSTWRGVSGPDGGLDSTAKTEN